MSMVKPLSNGCENTSASGTGAASRSAACGVYRSWKCACAAAQPSAASAAASTLPLWRGSRESFFNVAPVDLHHVAITGVHLHPEGNLWPGETELAALVEHTLHRSEERRVGTWWR